MSEEIQTEGQKRILATAEKIAAYRKGCEETQKRIFGTMETIAETYRKAGEAEKAEDLERLVKMLRGER